VDGRGSTAVSVISSLIRQPAVVAVTGHITVAGVVNVAEIVAWNLGHLRFSDIINSSSALSKLDRTTALSLTPLSVNSSLEYRGLIYQYCI
jgi:site-specific recombinase